MTESGGVELGQIAAEIRGVLGDLERALSSAADEEVSALVGDLDSTKAGIMAGQDPPLSIAFVGQYDAGKSTILRALTGRRDIVIDSDVSTDVVTAYDWNGLRLLDTPGIYAGHPEHDERTYEAIDAADLLVFVITNELFDETIGRHFRELAFTRQHAHKMLLVVNKMAQDPGAPDAKRPDIEKVTAPLTADDFRTIFIDARSWLEAQNATSDEDRADLLAIANHDALVGAVNRFARERGLAGRLSAPLFAIRAGAEQAHALLSAEFAEERAVLELLHRKRRLLLESRSRLQNAMDGLVARAVADIASLGDRVAEAIEPGRTEADINALHEEATHKARDRADELSSQAKACVEKELNDLRREFDALHHSVLARELRELTVPGPPGEAAQSAPRMLELTWDGRPAGVRLGDWPAKAKKIGEIANSIGSWAGKWATGPAAASARMGSATAARGSEAHRFVYDVGKFFGVKFQPWGAVRVARVIGNAGRVISAVGGVLAVVAQIAEDRQQEHCRLQLRQARDGVRTAYRDAARSIEDAFRRQFDAFVSDFYGAQLTGIDDATEGLSGKRAQRSSEATLFADIAQRASGLIERVEVAVAEPNSPPDL